MFDSMVESFCFVLNKMFGLRRIASPYETRLNPHATWSARNDRHTVNDKWSMRSLSLDVTLHDLCDVMVVVPMYSFCILSEFPFNIVVQIDVYYWSFTSYIILICTPRNICMDKYHIFVIFRWISSISMFTTHDYQDCGHEKQQINNRKRNLNKFKHDICVSPPNQLKWTVVFEKCLSTVSECHFEKNANLFLLSLILIQFRWYRLAMFILRELLFDLFT